MPTSHEIARKAGDSSGSYPAPLAPVPPPVATLERRTDGLRQADFPVPGTSERKINQATTSSPRDRKTKEKGASGTNVSEAGGEARGMCVLCVGCPSWIGNKA